MLNDQIKTIGLLAREIARAALRPGAPEDLGVIASDIAVVPNTMLPPLGDASTIQHAVHVAKIMVECLHEAEADIRRCYEDEGEARFPAGDDALPSIATRRRARRGGRERVLYRRDETHVRGEGLDLVRIACLTYENGVEVVALLASASAFESGPACLLSPKAAREAAAALLAAADALEASAEP